MTSTTALIMQAGSVIEERIGIAAFAQLHAVLEDLLVTLSEGNLADYIRTLREKPITAPIWQRLIGELTIGETYFLRDRSHFDLIRHHILPLLIDERRKTNDKSLAIWSAGCASGEEAYSLAALLRETIPDIDQWSIRLMGTDINESSLRLARRGLYRPWAFRHAPEAFKSTYFTAERDGLRIRSFVRDMVMFKQSNLMTDLPMVRVDLILCRNVLLYFSRNNVTHMEQRFHQALKPGGWLLLGHSEAIQHDRTRWLTHLFPGTSPAYQKPPIPGVDDVIFEQHDAITPNQAPVVALPDVSTLHREAVRALQSDQLQKADAVVTQILEQQPKHTSAHVIAATIAANQQRYDSAHRHIDIALESDPLCADAHYMRAVVYIDQRKNDLALKSLRAALYCQRRHSLSLFMLGNLSAQQGDINRALRHWRTARESLLAAQAERPVSEVSDMTVAQLRALLDEQINGWSG